MAHEGSCAATRKAFLLTLLFASSAALSQTTYYKTYTLPAEAVTPVINTLYQDRQGYILFIIGS
ncbi:MAG: hypothetical protein EOO88_53200 [Pedobacter sp.]|nr:MAG: hypothetical protein EOO88_53200 [Pedobacter sp.]